MSVPKKFTFYRIHSCIPNFKREPFSVILFTETQLFIIPFFLSIFRMRSLGKWENEYTEEGDEQHENDTKYRFKDFLIIGRHSY